MTSANDRGCVKTSSRLGFLEDAPGAWMKRFVESCDRRQGVLLPEYLEDHVAEDNPVRMIDVFVDELDLGELGFECVVPEANGRPG